MSVKYSPIVTAFHAYLSLSHAPQHGDLESYSFLHTHTLTFSVTISNFTHTYTLAHTHTHTRTHSDPSNYSQLSRCLAEEPMACGSPLAEGVACYGVQPTRCNLLYIVPTDPSSTASSSLFQCDLHILCV